MSTYATFRPTVRIEAAGLQALTFGPGEGLDLLALDIGDAAVRVVAQDAPQADGSIDTTTYVGARVISLSVQTVDLTWAKRNRLRAFTSPRLRPTLVLKLDADAPEVQITCRPLGFAETTTTDDRLGDMTTSVVQFVGVLGVMESTELHTVNAYAGGAGTELGRSYDLTFDRTYPDSPTLGSAIVVNSGTFDAYPLIRLYGPVTDPVLVNDTQGKRLAFTSLTINAGEFLEVDTRAKTIRYNGLASDSRYNRLSFPTSAWFTLSPGTNNFRYLPATSSTPASAEINWRDAWL